MAGSCRCVPLVTSVVTPVFHSRNRLAAGLCLMLSLGSVVNVVVLQGGRAPEAAVAATLPAQTTLETARTQPIILGTPQTDLTTPSTDPVGSLMASADADLAARTAEGAEATVAEPIVDEGFASEKLIAGIQRELASHGYDPGKVNGKAGIVTRAAILAYQFDQRLALTAEPSPELLRQIVMGLAGTPGAATEPAGDKATRIIAGAQRLLTRLGYKPGPIDGQLNDATRKALKRFETDSGFVPKGRVSGEVISELARQAHARIEVSDEALPH